LLEWHAVKGEDFSSQNREAWRKLFSSLKSDNKTTQHGMASHVIAQEKTPTIISSVHNTTGTVFWCVEELILFGFCHKGNHQCYPLPSDAPEASSRTTWQTSREDKHSAIRNARPNTSRLCVERIQKNGWQRLHMHIWDIQIQSDIVPTCFGVTYTILRQLYTKI
jgi:hypothetical protein